MGFSTGVRHSTRRSRFLGIQSAEEMNTRALAEGIGAPLAKVLSEPLAMLPAKPWTRETWGQWTAAVKDATGRKGKDLFKPLRHALTGRSNGPEMADVMPLLQVVRGV